MDQERYKPVDLSKLRTYSIGRRTHKFDARQAAGLPEPGASFRQWFDSLPGQLAVQSLRRLVEAVAAARRADRPVVTALGAHVVKVGCSPIVCDLVRRGIVTAVSLNGATAIHDVEVALFGQTSEEVADTLHDGSFGMVEETPKFFADALGAAPKELGLGAALGDHLLKTSPPNAEMSILAAARRAGIPATVHVALGTDTIHMHASLAGSDLPRRSEIDFLLICAVVADLGPKSNSPAPGSGEARPNGGGTAARPEGRGSSKGHGPQPPSAVQVPACGVWINVGSAVLLPEVFLKAVAVARNLGTNLDMLTTANLDMLRHYRPSQNVTGRPVAPGRGLSLTGHHELLLPLLRQAIIEAM